MFLEVFATVNFSGCKGTTLTLLFAMTAASCFISMVLQQIVQAAVGKDVDVVGLMFMM